MDTRNLTISLAVTKRMTSVDCVVKIVAADEWLVELCGSYSSVDILI